MLIKTIVDEDFTNYKLTSMFIALGTCNWKCCTEENIPISICQNSELARQKDIEVSADEIFSRYISNPLTSAVVIGGLEPFTIGKDIIDLVKRFRFNGCNDAFIIYTGYYPHEIEKEINQLKAYDNVILKYGRFKPNNQPHYDEVLGVNLVSDNQYAERISQCSQ